ncbi:MAG: hypothetical protein M3246_02785 [Actinomycetota bacterium]|nr:hypothetical protein [Actinomycetota bacterium]
MDVQQAESINEATWKYSIQEERDLDAWREQVEQARREQAVSQVLAQGSANAYAGFLESLFHYYRECVRTAERGAAEG